MENYLLQRECYEIIGCCMEIHRILGKGLSEIVYKDAMEYEFKKNNIPYEREKPFLVNYKDTILPHKFYADFVCYENLIVEVKASSEIINQFVNQTLNYISIAKSPLGLVINFGGDSLEFKRVIR